LQTLDFLGAQSAGPAIVTIVVDMVITSSLCIALSRLGHPGGAWVALRNALKGMAANPMPWAIALGALASWAQWTLPAPVEQTVAMLAGAVMAGLRWPSDGDAFFGLIVGLCLLAGGLGTLWLSWSTRHEEDDPGAAAATGS